MLDVHAPHSKIHGFGEFFLHLLTITVGLLIATQIESCMEWRHHVHLAEDAQTSLHQEIVRNLADMKDAESGESKWRQEVDDNLKALRRIQDHPDDPEAQHAKLAFNFHSIDLRDTAWRTAQSTGALAYMPYEEALRYSEIYWAEGQFVATQEQPKEDVASLIGLLARFNWNDKTKITVDQAGQMAERLGQMKLHIVTRDLLLKKSIEKADAFLQNRPAKEDFTVNID
ncbi:MAG: hypothetical protein WBQ95_09350 [Terracidiphilus sp.]